MKTVSLNDEEVELASAALRDMASVTYQRATAEELDDRGAEREKMARADRKIAALLALAEKFST